MNRLLLPLLAAALLAACAAPAPSTPAVSAPALPAVSAVNSAVTPAATSAVAPAPVPAPVPAAAPAAVAAAPAADPDSIVTIHYVCDGANTLRVRFDNNAGVAYVSQSGGAELRLPQQRAASGIWYATPQHELRGKGSQATWTVGRRAPLQCKAQQP